MSELMGPHVLKIPRGEGVIPQSPLSSRASVSTSSSCWYRVSHRCVQHFWVGEYVNLYTCTVHALYLDTICRIILACTCRYFVWPCSSGYLLFSVSRFYVLRTLKCAVLTAIIVTSRSCHDSRRRITSTATPRNGDKHGGADVMRRLF